MIGIAVFQVVWQVGWHLMRRPGARLERLEGAVFGETGVNMKLHRYVSTEAFEKRVDALTAQMKGISEEGEAREDRILQAIERSNTLIGSDVREIKADVREQSRRIDDVIREQRN